MPEEEVAVFDQDALKKRVSETIQAQFGMMIPEKEWTKLVEKEIRAFFEQKKTSLVVEQEDLNPSGDYRYRGKELRIRAQAACTPFRLMVWEHLRSITKNKVARLFQGEKLKSVLTRTWEGNLEHTEAELGSLLEATLEKLIPEMLKQVLRNIVGQTAEEVKDRILQDPNRM